MTVDDEATAWRVFVLRQAMLLASKLRHQAQDCIAELRRAGVKRRGPGAAELREAQNRWHEHSECLVSLQGAIDILVPPTSGPEKCSQGWRRWYTPEASAVMRRATEMTEG